MLNSDGVYDPVSGSIDWSGRRKQIKEAEFFNLGQSGLHIAGRDASLDLCVAVTDHDAAVCIDLSGLHLD